MFLPLGPQWWRVQCINTVTKAELGCFEITCPWQLLLSKFASFLSIQRDFEPYQLVRKYIFFFFFYSSSTSGSWCLHQLQEVDDLIVFSAQLGDFSHFTAQELLIWKLGVWLLCKNCATLKSLVLHGQKIHSTAVWHSEVLATLGDCARSNEADVSSSTNNCKFIFVSEMRHI